MSLLLPLFFPSGWPDVHWLLTLPEGVGCALAAFGGASFFRSLSRTESPNETVLRRLEVVPGVNRILFVGDARACAAVSVSDFLDRPPFPGLSAVSFGMSLLLRW